MSMHEHRPRHKWSNFITTRPKRSCRSQKPKCFGHISHHNSPDKDIRRKAVILEEFCQCRISSDSASISNVSITNRTGRDSLCRSRIPKPVIGSLPACSCGFLNTLKWKRPRGRPQHSCIHRTEHDSGLCVDSAWNVTDKVMIASDGMRYDPSLATLAEQGERE